MTNFLSFHGENGKSLQAGPRRSLPSNHFVKHTFTRFWSLYLYMTKIL